MNTGAVVVLNGAPRSGKSSVAAALVATDTARWVNIGVDTFMATTEPELLPGIGLRPGGERPDLEQHIPGMYAELFGQVADAARKGRNVAVDVGLHCDYATQIDPVAIARRQLAGPRVLWVGVQCDLDEIVRRRDASTGPTRYLSTNDEGRPADPVIRWQHAVHADITYDLELDTTRLTATECAALITRSLAS